MFREWLRRTLARVDPGPLRNNAMIVRGGLMELPSLRNALQTSWVETGNYELSFFAANELSVGEIAAAAQRPIPRLPHAKVRVSTIGQMRSLGLEPFPEGLFPHVVIRFQISPSENQLMELGSAFGDPIANPAAFK